MLRKNSKWFRIVQEISKEYAVKLQFTTDDNSAYPNYDLIKVATKYRKVKDFLSAFFHELAHVVCYRTGKFVVYNTIRKKVSIKTLKTCVHTAIRAEKYTDKVGAKLMKRHFPDIGYIKGYDAKAIKWFKEIVLWPEYVKPLREKLEKKKGK